MFKSKEDLMEGKRGLICVGIDDAFKSIAERKKFYEKYRDCPEMYANHFPDNEWWKVNEDNYRKINNTTCSSQNFYEETYKLQRIIDDFNHWLFHYCFDEVK